VKAADEFCDPRSTPLDYLGRDAAVDVAEPRLSIVVATKNARTCLNVLLMDYRAISGLPLELVIADGGSEDGTAGLLAATAESLRVGSLQWLSRADTGIAEAWNRAVRLVSAPWVMFAGADDRLADGTEWAALLDWLPSCPRTASLVGLSVQMVSRAGRPLSCVTPSTGPRNERIYSVNSVPHQGLLHSRELFSELGDFDTQFRVAADYEYILRAITRGKEIVLPPDRLSPIRMTFGGLSADDPLANVLEFRNAQLKHGIRRRRFGWWAAWIRAWMRSLALPLLGPRLCGGIADVLRRLRGLPPVWSAQ
jgi:glycosyltransferase involved in cell wall biosynthesis